MTCECGEILELSKNINIFKNHILVVTTCTCGRSIHQSFDLVETTFFCDDKLEKVYRNKDKY